MHRFSRMHLSPEAALCSLAALDREEKSKLAECVALIAVIDHRRDYLAAGHPSMCDYCVRRLHMSEDKALKRIQVARAERGRRGERGRRRWRARRSPTTPRSPTPGSCEGGRRARVED